MVGFVMSTVCGKADAGARYDVCGGHARAQWFYGLALLLGGLRHREQPYNLQSANAFLVMILPLTVLGLVLPNYTGHAGPMLSTFQMVSLAHVRRNLMRFSCTFRIGGIVVSL